MLFFNFHKYAHYLLLINYLYGKNFIGLDIYFYYVIFQYPLLLFCLNSIYIVVFTEISVDNLDTQCYYLSQWLHYIHFYNSSSFYYHPTYLFILLLIVINRRTDGRTFTWICLLMQYLLLVYLCIDENMLYWHIQELKWCLDNEMVVSQPSCIYSIF